MVSVIGSGGGLDEEQVQLAETLGVVLVRAGYGVVCGGGGGVMEAVARGARLARGEAKWPPIIGILPGYDVDAGNEHLDVVIPTGLGHARNAVVVAAGEAAICVAGRTGALSEVGLARKIGRPVLAFPGSGGTAGLVSKAIDSVIPVKTPEEAIERLAALLALQR